MRKDDQIVLYDLYGMQTVARAAWMLRFYGATDVKIMNGGLYKWISEKKATHGGKYVNGEGLP